jgi:hypothetical protein
MNSRDAALTRSRRGWWFKIHGLLFFSFVRIPMECSAEDVNYHALSPTPPLLFYRIWEHLTDDWLKFLELSKPEITRPAPCLTIVGLGDYFPKVAGHDFFV